MAGFVIMMIVGVSGAAIDYSRVFEKKRDLQSRLDAATLAAVGAGFSTDAERENFAKAYMADTFVAMGPDPEISLNLDGDAFKAEATYDAPTTVLSIFGIKTIPLTVNTKVSRMPPMAHDIALVLDVTASMEGDKMVAMKTAAKNLASSVLMSDKMRIAVVPFAQYVNIGKANKDEPGLDIPADIAAGAQCWQVEEETCVVETTCYDGDVEYACWNEVCTPTGTGIMVEKCESDLSTWNGWMGSREYPGNVIDDATDTAVPGLLGSEHWQERSTVLALTSELESIETKIDSLAAYDDTYIPSGLVWGWRMVSNRIPFASGSDHAKTKRVIVLMSDGINTISRDGTSEWHGGTDGAVADTLTAELCTSAKADGVTIYTVAYDIEEVDGRKLLQDCATDPNKMFYLANDADELIGAFEEIGASFSRLRISG